MAQAQSAWGIDLSTMKQHSVTYSTGREKKVCKIFYFWIQIEREDFDLKKFLLFSYKWKSWNYLQHKLFWPLGHSVAKNLRHRGRALTRGGCLHKELRWVLKPLHPNISIHNLHTVLCTFINVLTRRICPTIKSFSRWWSFPLFSWHWCMIQWWYYMEKLDVSCSKGLKG